MNRLPEHNTLSRNYRTRFGAELLTSGEVCFRLWAPTAQQVEVCLQGEFADSCYPMQPEADAWFICKVMVNCGCLYRFRINKQHYVPDPASRYQPADVNGYSQVINPDSWIWRDDDWVCPDWSQAVIYELHVGSFTPEGTFRAVTEKLPHLSALGFSAIQLMPVADFYGRHNWGYDGVLPFAPDSRYGSPDDLKCLVQTAHAQGMMVILDVVYNHFGPEGNYLHLYAAEFFSPKNRTPWGAGFNFDGRHSHWVRQFFIENALYWLHEFHFDGLRLDAVQAIIDNSPAHFLQELAITVQQQFEPNRRIHLILENDDNTADYLTRDGQARPKYYTAQWNDDFHHALHVLMTGENFGYYQDYTDDPIQHLSDCLTSGFSYHGQFSPYRRQQRGQPCQQLPPLAFISFIQNHDQIGNRPHSERIHALASETIVRAVTALWLLAPFPPMFFMGQEWGCTQAFAFFCDFEPALAKRINQARRREFACVPGFETAKARRSIADPSALSSFQASVLDWGTLDTPQAEQWLDFHRQLLALRRQEIMPRLAGMLLSHASAKRIGHKAVQVEWQMGDGSNLVVAFNFSSSPVLIGTPPSGSRLLFASCADFGDKQIPKTLPAWSVIWTLSEG